MKKRLIYMSSIFSLVAVSIVAGLMYSQQSNAGILTVTELQFTAEVTDKPIMVKPGETINIPVKIISEKASALDVKAGVTGDGYETYFALTGERILPKGISAEIDKNSVTLPSTAEKGFAHRDTVSLTISVASDAEKGEYPLTFVLAQTEKDGSVSEVRSYFLLQVQ